MMTPLPSIQVHSAPPLHLFLGLGNRIFDQLHDETMILKSMGLMNQTAYQWAHASPRCM